MKSDFINLIKEQKKIPIIGKGSEEEIKNKIIEYIDDSFKIIEITLRSKNALKVAIDTKEKYTDLLIGLGSIISSEQLNMVSKYNFDFYVSPGINPTMLEIAEDKNLNYIPGISTSSEIITGIAKNYNLFKFFPAELSGGIKLLQSYSDIFSEIKFIPTGGINNTNFNSYIELQNVIAVGSTKF